MIKLISTAWAYDLPPLPELEFCDPKNINWDDLQLRHLVCIFNRIYNALILSVGAVFIIWMIISGIRYMAAGGDEKAVAAARSSLTYAVVGFILVLAAYAVLAILGTLLGAGFDIPIFTIPERSL